MQVDAIVLAGAKNDGKLLEISACEFEALIPINEQPMINYVVTALQETTAVRRIVVVGHAEIRDYIPKDVIWLECGRSLSENIKIGIDYLQAVHPVLIITSDIPMINKTAIEDFINRCSGQPGDLYYPIIAKEINDQVYPGVKRTYVRLRDGIYTGGNMVLMAPNLITDCYAMIQRVIQLRKQPVKITRLLGFIFLVKLALRRLTVAEIEERIIHLFGIQALAVISPYPEIGTDVDKPSDWELASRILSTKMDQRNFR